MSSPNRLFTPLGILVDLALVGLFFLFFLWVLPDFVPAESPDYKLFWSALTAGCLSIVFWFTVSMFRVVIVDERKRNREGG